MADTPDNRLEFSKQQSQHQKFPGCGYPMGRLVAIFSLATGGLIDVKTSNYKGKGTGELSLMRQLWDNLHKGETLLADALFTNYFVIEKAIPKGVHVVSELPKHRLVTRRHFLCHLLCKRYSIKLLPRICSFWSWRLTPEAAMWA